MMPISLQIETGKLVCPRTHQRLYRADDSLITKDGCQSYEVKNGVPILFADPVRQAEYLAENTSMEREYQARASESILNQRYVRFLAWIGDFRSYRSKRAFEQAICQQPTDELCISIGGGPGRAHSNLVNVNIAAFPNVDVVADAYELPYADESVAAIYCEAVIEHLEFPDAAVKEMFRVLKTGGQVFAVTPFLQAFHAYPTHFQNFTLRGHERLFERAGFSIISSGVCVGPNYAMADLVVYYLQQFVPIRAMAGILSKLCVLASLPIRALDLILNRYTRSAFLASTTYVHLEKL